MRRSNGQLGFSPSDVNNFLECEHLTQLELAVALGELERPVFEDPQAELIRRKGEEHERAYLESLRAAGKEVIEIELAENGKTWDLERAARDTEGAMRAGAEVIYQGVLSDPAGWVGIADFLERVERPSALGPWGYEASDTKLARRPKPTYVVQLCFYSEQVGRLQRVMPAAMHVLLGTGERETLRPADFAAYYRRVRERFLEAVARRPATYPYPVQHCGICVFRPLCEARWDADDHLVRVANIRRDQIVRLAGAGITTLERLGTARAGTEVRRMRPETFETLRHQAELQLWHRRTGAHRFDPLPLEEKRGFGLLPRPSPGDVFFDIEGDPFYEPARGLEYLFGVVFLEGGRPRFHAFWGLDRAGEKRAFEELVDFLSERRRRFPDMHVYHYAHYEPTALKRLMGEHGSREDQVDDLLRGEVFVDLYKVVRQAMRISYPRYSLKQVENFYRAARETDVVGGGESIVRFEEWLETGEARMLDEIAAYNEEDCLSTYELREWLLGLRPGEVVWRALAEPRELAPEAAEAIGARERLKGRLLAGSEEGDARWLAAQLLDYHRREAKPAWWAHFNRLTMTGEELIEEGDSIGGIEPADGPPARDGRSLVYTLTFPPQEHKLGDDAIDPRTERSPGTIVSIDDERGEIFLRRATRREDEPLPSSLIPPTPYSTVTQRSALERLARSVADGDGRYGALEDVLARGLPRAELGGSAVDAALSLDGSHLFVQGPPGSGKTYAGARMAVALMRAGRRIGVSSTSHKAIHKFLADVEEAAREAGYRFRGLKKCGERDGTRFEGDGSIENSGTVADFVDPALQLVAGTAWLFAREELDSTLDTLFVDEAGQVALADAVAMGTCARNLVLLGDPNQLAHVSQGIHPAGTERSVLQHLLEGFQTVPPERGLFLAETWRLRPEVCGFVSEAFYEGRLRPAPVSAQRSFAGGHGLRFLPVEHDANRQSSPEEAEAVAAEIERLVGLQFADADGRLRPLRYDDVKVVTPYNAQVRCLRGRLPREVAVGTVDKFQGQEAPVVVFSMATSSGDYLPRNLAFLFSRNRLNVAVSRAQCLAVGVFNPKLLEIRCRTVEEMRLVNALCRFVEVAQTA